MASTSHKLVLQEIVEKMKCAECENYLRPPISYCDNNENICESCTTESYNTIIGINTQLESIGSLLKFPCRFYNFGCQLSVAWAEAELHESECPFRQFTCPKCTWTGKAIDMKTHVTSSHRVLPDLTTNFSLSQSESLFFIITMEELYILFFHCDADAGLLRFDLKYVGPLEQAKRRHFKLILKPKPVDSFYKVPTHMTVFNCFSVKDDLTIL